jgi:hypothetical protein
MTRERDRPRAGTLLIAAGALWWHEWLPALLVVAFVVWALLQYRLGRELGHALLRQWPRIWPPARLVLVPLLLAATAAFWLADQPPLTKVLPITLNLLGLSIVVYTSLSGRCARMTPACSS